MSHPQWTDGFLNVKRQEGDIWYDDQVRDVLGVSFLDPHNTVFADWAKSQSEQVSEAIQIKDGLPTEGDLPAATIQQIDQLSDRHTQQYAELDKWSLHLWPDEFQFHIHSMRLTTIIACKALMSRRLEAALAAMTCALTNAALLERHHEQFVARAAAQPDLKQHLAADNLADYNRLLQISDAIRKSPALVLSDHGFRKAQFMSYPVGLSDSFTPMWCPDWVDENKLRIGARLWQEHMVACLLVLFAHSLPACYLDKRGIPMLYRTERLGKQEFLAQRIYETAFMLRDVMEEGGLSVISDTGAMQTAWLAAAVHTVHRDWTFELGRYLKPEWKDAQGNTHTHLEMLADRAVQTEYQVLVQRGAMPETYSASDLGCTSFEWLFRHYVGGAPNPTFNYFRGRCLWGPGLLAATKVRYLHASMRYRALRDDPPYDVQENGMPINQEDLAYTLLTFGYVIPLGVEKLGGILSREEKEAFLHCWKVVGFIMGIDDDLLTDDWDQAKGLYEKIKSRQQGPSANGVILTSALCTFITNLLPAWLPFRGALAPVLIRDQLGADADDLFDASGKAASRNLMVRGCWAFVKHVLLGGYFWSRHYVFDRIPATRVATDAEVQFMGMTVIESWKQTYERHRFDLTAREKGFTANLNITEAQHEERAVTRREVFRWTAAGLGLIVLFHPFFWIGVASLVAWHFSSATWLGWVVNAMFWLVVISVIGVGVVEGKLQTLLQKLAFQPRRLF